MHNDVDYDVIVAGAGPAGSTAATFVAMQGYRVLLLEKQTMPAYKIGESLLPATVHGICPMLGVSEELKRANFVPKRGGTFVWGKGRKTWDFLFAASSKLPGPTSMAYQVERMKFDSILLENAKRKGVDVREQHSITGLITERDRVAGVEYRNSAGTSHFARSRYVVDASGHQTTLARYAGERMYSKFFQNVALFGYYRGGGRLPAPNQGNILCACFEHGWFWYIPLSESLTSVGAVISKDKAPMLQCNYETVMDELIHACPAIHALLSNASRVVEGPYGELRVRKDYSYLHTSFWKQGLVLIGDAACFIDPVFSSGVHLATYSALLAARSINSSLRGDIEEESCFSEFEARYRREYSHFYDFLIAFYDLSSDVESYFWKARKVTNSPESANIAFIELVAGMGGSGERVYGSTEEFLKCRDGLGDLLFPQATGSTATDSKTVSRRSKFYNDLLSEIVQVQLQATMGDKRPRDAPLFPQGLVVSSDGLHWTNRTAGVAR